MTTSFYREAVSHAGEGHPSRPGASRPFLWGALALCLLLSGWLAWTRGGWLDEFWTVWHSNPAVPFGRAYRTRWVHDTQHPPAFYALAWAFGRLTGPGLGLRRLAGDAVGLLLVVPPVLLSRRGGRVPMAVVVLLLLVLSGPYAVTYLAEHRSYALGLLAATALLIALRTVHLAAWSGGPVGTGRSLGLLGTALVAGNLHYTLAMVQLILLGCFALFHGWHRRWAAVGLAVGAALVIVGPLGLALWLALRQATPIIAIHVGLWAGWRTIALMLTLGFVANPVLLVRAVQNARWLKAGPAAGLNERAGLVLILLAALVLAALAFAVLEVLARNMYPRLLLGLLPLAALIVAELAAARAVSWRVSLAAGANAVLVAAATVAFQHRDPRIDSLGPVLAATVHQCSTTRIVAVDPLALTALDDPLRHMAGQDQAVTIGYRMSAARWGVTVSLWPEETPIAYTAGRCPTLLWMEHAFMVPQGIDAATLLSRLRLHPPAGTRISEVRDRWHYLVRITPPASVPTA